MNESEGAFAPASPTPKTFWVDLERRGDNNWMSVEVTVCVVGGCTAWPGTEFALDPSFSAGRVATLTFLSGENSKPFNISFYDDSIQDGHKVVTMELRNAYNSGPTPALIDTPLSTLTVIDDETPGDGFGFRFARYSAPEHTGDHRAAVLIDRVGSETVLAEAGSVQVSIAAGTTAVLGTDYQLDDPATPLSGSPPTATVFFAPGQKSQRFYLRTRDDAAADGDKKVILVLGNALGSPLGALRTAELTLVDEEIARNGTDGLPIVTLDISDLLAATAPSNRCDVNPNLARNPNPGAAGPCGASPVSPVPCSEGMLDAITSA